MLEATGDSANQDSFLSPGIHAPGGHDLQGKANPDPRSVLPVLCWCGDNQEVQKSPLARRWTARPLPHPWWQTGSTAAIWQGTELCVQTANHLLWANHWSSIQHQVRPNEADGSLLWIESPGCARMQIKWHVLVT